MTRVMSGGRSALLSSTAALVLTGAIPTRVQQLPAAPPLVFDGVTVVDIEQGKLVPDQRVVVAGNRIQAVGSSRAVKLPKDVQVVDARGKYLIPGLWDMHVHAAIHAHTYRNIYAHLVANGITGVREMSTSWPAGFDSIRQYRRKVANDTMVGPRIVATSYDFYSPVCNPDGLKEMARSVYRKFDSTGTPDSSQLSSILSSFFALDSAGCFAMNAHTVTTPDEVRRMVDTLKAAGVDFVKAHFVSDPKVYFAFLAEARRVGIPAVGHLRGMDGRAVTEIEASDSGLRSVEHINEMSCWHRPQSSVPLPDSIAERQCAAVAERFGRNGTWLVPTLFYVFNHSADSVRYRYRRAVGLLHRVGVPMLAGTDAQTQPESALHEELALLVDAGLTPLEALRTATLHPAQFFDATDSLGTVAAGKVADVLLLEANPLTDIRNTRTIRAVVANGQYFDRAALDDLLARGSANDEP